jgi:ribonuclease HI
MNNNTMDVKIFTDGSCHPNPGYGGWAALIYYGDQEQVLSGSELRTTSSRMEMAAAIEALKSLPGECSVLIITEAEYLAKGVGYLQVWRQCGWLKSTGEPVKNRDLWEEYIRVAEPHQVKIELTRGHIQHPEMRRVERLSKAARIMMSKTS